MTENLLELQGIVIASVCVHTPLHLSSLFWLPWKQQITEFCNGLDWKGPLSSSNSTSATFHWTMSRPG